MQPIFVDFYQYKCQQRYYIFRKCLYSADTNTWNTNIIYPKSMSLKVIRVRQNEFIIQYSLCFSFKRY